MAPDYIVYNHFKKKFEEKLEAFGSSRMAHELNDLHFANEQKVEECNFQAADNRKLSGKFKWWGPAALVGYLAETGEGAENEECTLMTMSEISFINRIKNYMLQKFPKKG